MLLRIQESIRHGTHPRGACDLVRLIRPQTHAWRINQAFRKIVNLNLILRTDPALKGLKEGGVTVSKTVKEAGKGARMKMLPGVCRRRV